MIDAKKYPAISEILAACGKIRQNTVQIVFKRLPGKKPIVTDADFRVDSDGTKTFESTGWKINNPECCRTHDGNNLWWMKTQNDFFNNIELQVEIEKGNKALIEKLIESEFRHYKYKVVKPKR